MAYVTKASWRFGNPTETDGVDLGAKVFKNGNLVKEITESGNTDGLNGYAMPIEEDTDEIVFRIRDLDPASEKATIYVNMRVEKVASVCRKGVITHQPGGEPVTKTLTWKPLKLRGWVPCFFPFDPLFKA